MRPGGCFPLPVARVDGELHRVDRPGNVAEQLARVGDPGIRGKARLDARHRVESLEGGVVAAELDERIADDAVVASGRRRDRMRAAPEHEGLTKAVAGERQRAEAAGRDQVARGQGERPVQRFVRLRVVGRVACLARTLLVSEPE